MGPYPVSAWLLWSRHGDISAVMGTVESQQVSQPLIKLSGITIQDLFGSMMPNHIMGNCPLSNQ